jgi:hypothetical protein
MTVEELQTKLARAVSLGRVELDDEVLVRDTLSDSWVDVQEILLPNDHRFMICPEGWDS